MKTTIQTNIANLIFDIVTNKGTCFAGFDYHGKRRNLTLGANLANRSKQVGNWGESTAKGSLVKHKGEYYLQGLPNNENANHIKRFKFSDIENLVIG
jgi:hypothetical protein